MSIIADAGGEPHTPVCNVDLFLSYNSLDREFVTTVQQLLEQRNIVVFLDRTSLLPGAPWFDALSEALARVRAFAVFIGPSGLGAWQKREMSLALDRQAREERHGRAFPVIPVLLPGTDLEKAPGFLLLNTWVDLRNASADPRSVDPLVRAVRRMPPAVDGPRVDLCPYRALNAFREDDAALFFGREVLALELLQRFRIHHVVAVVGPSGSGKSSLVQAGLLPLLRRERPPQSSWDVAIFTPGKRPFHALAAALIPLCERNMSRTDRLIEAEKLGSSLAAQQVSIDAAVDLTIRELSGTDRLLLIIDQFEELFTLTPDAERPAFIRAIESLAQNSAASLLMTIRADFYGHVIASSRILSDRMQNGVVNVGPMTTDELRRAIEHPARAVGVTFEPGLVGRILDHVNAQPGSLPLLEFALSELWQVRDGGNLTHAGYDSIGRVDGAVSRRAEEQFRALGSKQQQLILRLFSRLVRVASAAEEGTDTRRRVPLTDVDEQTRAVAQTFIAARLLVAREDASGHESVEMAHEALTYGWQRFRELLDRNRQFLIWRQRLSVLTSEWQRTGYDSGVLLRGAPLLEAKQFFKERLVDLNDVERRFIQASAKNVQRQGRWAAAVAAAIVMSLSAAGAWALWTRSDTYQVRLMLEEAPSLIPASEKQTTRWWLYWLVRSGRASEAQDLVRSVRDPAVRAWGLLGMADAFGRLGNRDRAHDAAAQSVVATRSLARVSASVEFRDIAEALARIGHLEEASDAARAAVAATRAGSVAEFDGLTPALTAALASAGQADEALALARDVKGPLARLAALLRIVRAIVRSGDVGQALSILREAIEIARSNVDAIRNFQTANDLDETRRMVVAALAEARNANAAINIALDIALPEARAETLIAGAGGLAKAGLTEDASRAADAALTALRQAGPEVDLDLFLEAAAVFGTLGQFDRARGAASMALAQGAARRETTVLIGLAAAVAKSGQQDALRKAVDEALGKIRAIENDPQDFVEVSKLLLDSGLGEQGGRVAREAFAHRRQGDEADPDLELTIADLLARAGLADEAKQALTQALESAARIYDDPVDQTDVYVTALEGLVRMKDASTAQEVLNRIVAVAPGIADDGSRSETFRDAAQALASLGLFRLARTTAALCASSDDRLAVFATILAYASGGAPASTTALE
jgi:tetratricopeptide (TPR) repeat protein